MTFARIGLLQAIVNNISSSGSKKVFPGPKILWTKLKQVHKNLTAKTLLDELKAACDDGHVVKVESFSYHLSEAGISILKEAELVSKGEVEMA
jgi:hypothetical protein